MDNIGEVIFAVMVLLFSVFAGIKRFFEGKDVERRSRESDWTTDDLPEETRRMLFGEPTAPTAKPAQPRHNPDPFVEVRDVFNEMRRQIEVQTAKPKQGAPRPQTPPPVPKQQSPAQQRQHPLQPQYQPSRQQRPTAPQRPQPQQRHVQTQHPVAPPRQAPRPQPPRMVPQQSEGAMQRQQQTDERRYPQQQRRQQPRAAGRIREPDEGPTTPIQRAKHERPRAQRRRSGRWFSNSEDLRRGIILAEILGPPKAMQDGERQY